MKTSDLLGRAAELIENLADSVHGEFCSGVQDPRRCTDLSQGRGCLQFFQVAADLRARANLLDDISEDHPGTHTNCDACALLRELGEVG